MATEWKRLALNVPEELHEQLKAEAKQKHLSVNGLIRLGLSEWLDQEQRERGQSPESRTGQGKKRSHKGGK